MNHCKIITWDHWGYPIYDERHDPSWDHICHDWDYHEVEMNRINSWYKHVADQWLHDDTQVFQALFEMDELEDIPQEEFSFKPARDIRAEKTREYRKRRPKAQRYRVDTVVAAGLLFCLIGGHS